MASPVHTWSRRLAAAGTVLMLGVGAVACGDGKQEANGGSRSSATGAGTGSGSETDSSGVKWAGCMRENGVQVEDPKAGENPKVPDGVSQVLLDKARTKCGKGPGNQAVDGSTQIVITDQKKFEELRMKLLKCEREHGWTPPKPVNGSVSLPGDDPAFKLATKACKSITDEMKKYEKMTGPGQ
ncbi:hypothetical protein ACWC4D_23335 [Streptomyces sp. NPDC001288]|uniref:hypothetical protein n=1 Tax=Streptomyces sp. NPDC001297 TaxID=3364559 RepID=UPI0036A409A8